jgi:26S proteasome regulatory subunit T5
MEVDEKPKEDYTDIGGLDKQIKELVEAVVLPINHKDLFIKIGIKPPKGVLLYGAPGKLFKFILRNWYFLIKKKEKHY